MWQAGRCYTANRAALLPAASTCQKPRRQEQLRSHQEGPGSRHWIVLSLSEADAGGLQQYCLVLCVASFFASYSVELAGALDPAGEQRESKRD